MRKASPAPYSLALARATDPARCASHHSKSRVCPSHHCGLHVGCRTCRVTHVMCAGTGSSNDAYAAATAGFASPNVCQLPSSPPILGLFERLMGRRSLAGNGPGCGQRPRRRAALCRAKATDPARCASHHLQRRACPSYHFAMHVGRRA